MHRMAGIDAAAARPSSGLRCQCHRGACVDAAGAILRSSTACRAVMTGWLVDTTRCHSEPGNGRVQRRRIRSSAHPGETRAWSAPESQRGSTASVTAQTVYHHRRSRPTLAMPASAMAQDAPSASDSGAVIAIDVRETTDLSDQVYAAVCAEPRFTCRQAYPNTNTHGR